MKYIEEEMSKYEFKKMYEYFLNNFNEPGKTVTWSKYIYDFVIKYVNDYNSITSSLYNENNDEEYNKYKSEYLNILNECVDRDENGTPILDNNNPVITTQKETFENKITELNTKYKSVLEKVTENKTNNMSNLNEPIKIRLLKLDTTDIPNDIPPYIVGRIVLM